MRDILLALALIWCLYNTWALHHNFKKDRMANAIDLMTSKVMLSQEKRIDKHDQEIKEIVKVLNTAFSAIKKLTDIIVSENSEE